MTTTSKLAELFRAISRNDSSRATAVAAQICDQEEAKGHRVAARLLRGALADTSRKEGYRRSSASQPTAENISILSTALVRIDSHRDLAALELDTSTRMELNDVISEWKFSSQLRKAGIAPRTKLLFHGPPGCGKSVTAQALGKSLGLPVYMVRFDAVIGSFLGQTAVHLRQLFHFAETTPCVMLLDELDALGKERGNALDVGELDRIVISLLQELEHSKPLGVIVGTTNLPKHLDAALWRRFDLDINFAKPSQASMRRFIGRVRATLEFQADPKVMSAALLAGSYATAEKILLDSARRKLIRGLEKQL